MTPSLFLTILAILLLVPMLAVAIFFYYKHRILLSHRQRHPAGMRQPHQSLEARVKNTAASDSSSDQKTAANRILIVEDDKSVSDSMKAILEKQGFIVQAVDLAEDALEKVKNYEFNAILLDLSLPDRSGYDVLKEIRNDGVNVPVLIVTGTERDPSHGFGEGANDYILKPFGAEELASRVGSAVRSSFGVFSPKVPLDGMTIDMERQVLLVGSEAVKMSATEFSFLQLMALRKGKNTSLQMMTRHIFEDHQSRQTFDAVKATMNSINERLSDLKFTKKFLIDSENIELSETN